MAGMVVRLEVVLADEAVDWDAQEVVDQVVAAVEGCAAIDAVDSVEVTE